MATNEDTVQTYRQSIHLLSTSNSSSGTSEAELARAFHELDGATGYKTFLDAAVPSHSDDLFRPPPPLPNQVGVSGRIQPAILPNNLQAGALSPPPQVVTFTAITADSRVAYGLGHGFVKWLQGHPMPMPYEGTLHYTTWEELGSAANDFEFSLREDGEILIRFSVQKKLVGVIVAQRTSMLHGVVAYSAGKLHWDYFAKFPEFGK